MGFPTVTKDHILTALKNIGARDFSILYVASFIPVLGNSRTIIQDTIDALKECAGEGGTIVMPTFNWDYCSGEIFDPIETVSMTGVLTEHFRKQPGVVRSLKPPWCSFAAWGIKAHEIVGIQGSTPFGPDSIPQFLYEQNALYVLLGCGFDDGVIHIHWLEEKFKVPYRFWKTFKGSVRSGGRLFEDVSYMYARRKDINLEINTNHMTDKFEKTGMVNIQDLGLGRIASFTTKDYVDFITPFFEKDPLCALSSAARAEL